jgi:hypothetical protein
MMISNAMFEGPFAEGNSKKVLLKYTYRKEPRLVSRINFCYQVSISWTEGSNLQSSYFTDIIPSQLLCDVHIIVSFSETLEK